MRPNICKINDPVACGCAVMLAALLALAPTPAHAQGPPIPPAHIYLPVVGHSPQQLAATISYEDVQKGDDIVLVNTDGSGFTTLYSPAHAG